MPSREDYLRVLKLPPSATSGDVKRAYRQLVKVWHPDRFSNDPDLQARATAELASINEAYEALKTLAIPPSPTQPQSPPQPRPEPFTTNVRSGETARIVEIHPGDDHYPRRHTLVGQLVVVKDPIHHGNGWHSANVTFRSAPLAGADGALFASVRLQRV